MKKKKKKKKKKRRNKLTFIYQLLHWRSQDSRGPR